VPGFTTASLSSLAGRGVGMDVVKSETAAVGGRISVATEAGQGTTFRILPLTLAVTQALLVRPRPYLRDPVVDGGPGARAQAHGPREIRNTGHRVARRALQLPLPAAPAGR
jgi:hypothetical protein